MSATIKDGGPAFPVSFAYADKATDIAPSSGLTMRDYFAAKAMQGDWACQSAELGEWLNSSAQQSLEARAQLFYRMADAMLAAREVKA